MTAINPEAYVSAGYTVSTLTERADCSETVLRKLTLASDHTQRRFFPADWAVEWVAQTRSERLARAREIGLSADRLDAAIAWATGAFDAEVGAWSVCFRLETAREVARRFFGQPATILGLGLHHSLVEDFIRVSAPPPSEPGHAPIGAMGHHLAVLKRQPIETPGRALGFEALCDDLGGLQSLESLHLDEAGVCARAGVTLNDAGLAEDFGAGQRICEAANASERGAPWFPWLLTSYPLGSADAHTSAGPVA